jgi:hypothetical protein
MPGEQLRLRIDQLGQMGPERLGVCGDFRLEDQPLELRRHVLFALGNLLGTPTATEPRDRRVLWVKMRAATSGQFATFSETDEEAEFHTDSAFQPDPQRHLIRVRVAG